MTLRERIARDQRRRIVELLAEDAGFSHNADILRAGLAELGHDVRIDSVVELVGWLASAGLVAIVSEGPPLVCRLTERGLDLAEGRTVVRGVALPR